MTTLVLLRYGTAEKNEARLFGGPGSRLRPEGVTEIYAAAETIQRWTRTVNRVLCAPRLQCVESATILSGVLWLSVEIDDDLRPISLGIIEGLSEAEVAMRFPNIARRFALWRAGDVEVRHLQIRSADEPAEFYLRGRAVLARLCSARGNAGLVATGSIILVLLANACFGQSPGSGRYRETPWGPAGILTVTVTDANHSVDWAHSTIGAADV